MARCDRDGCRGGTFYGWTGRALGKCYRCNGTGEVREVGTGRKATAEAASAASRGAMLQIQAMPALPVRRAAPAEVSEGMAVYKRLQVARAAGASFAERYAIAFGDAEAPAEPEPPTPPPAAQFGEVMPTGPIDDRSGPVGSPGEPLHGIRNGFFTVVFGGEDRLTLRVQDDDWSGPAKAGVPGQQAVAYLNGPDNWRNYRSFAFVVGAAARPFKSAPERAAAALRFLMGGSLEDRKGAAEAYALESSRCSRCHRMLTVPASIHAGLGPDCAGKSEY